MSAAQRVSLVAGTLVATLAVLVIFQSATQEVKTQAEGGGFSAAERPTYPPTDTREFAGGRSLSGSKMRRPSQTLWLSTGAPTPTRRKISLAAT
jgi:hypothetical protein